jgi:hypothetical protein
VLGPGYRQVFRSWSGPGNPYTSKIVLRLTARFMSREVSRLALPLAAIPFWVLWNVGKADAVMAECTALTIGPALAVEAADGLLAQAMLMPRAHRSAVVRAVAVSIFHNVERIQLPLPGFGYSASPGAVHPNAAALLEHLENRCGILPPGLVAPTPAARRRSILRVRRSSRVEPSDDEETLSLGTDGALAAVGPETALDSISAFQKQVRRISPEYRTAPEHRAASTHRVASERQAASALRRVCAAPRRCAACACPLRGRQTATASGWPVPAVAPVSRACPCE